MSSKAPLQTGSVVLIQGVHVETQRSHHVSLVSCDGFASQDITLVKVEDWVRDSTQDIRDCFFQITQKLNYSALEDFRLANRGPARRREDIMVLKEKMKLEKRENQEWMSREARKENLIYGKVIQLRHVKSGKFLMPMEQEGSGASTDEDRAVAAVNEKDCRRLTLGEGGEGCHFRLHPMYKTKQLGEEVLPQDPVVLLNERLGSDWQMHFSEQPIKGGDKGREVRECNISTLQSGWRMDVFSKREIGVLTYGRIIKLFKSQHDGYIIGSSAMAMKSKDPNSAKKQKPPYVESANESWDLDDTISAKGLWVIERPDKTQGLNVFDTSEVVIRHLTSGGYLAIDTTAPFQLSRASAHYGVRAFQMTIASECDEEMCIFKLEPLGTDRDSEDHNVPLPNEGARVFLKQRRKYMGEDLDIYVHCTGETKAKAKQSRSCRSLQLCGLAARLESDGLLISAVADERAVKVEQVLSYRQKIIQTMQAIEALASTRGRLCLSNGWRLLQASLSLQVDCDDDVQQLINVDEAMREVQTLLRQLQQSLESALNLLTVQNITKEHSSESVTEFDEDEHVLNANAAPDSHFQHIFRETKTMDVLFEVAEALWRTHPRTEQTSKAHILLHDTEKDEGSDKDKDQGEGDVSALTARIHNLLFQTIKYCFLNSRRNENYVAKNRWMPVLLSRMAYGVGAENCFSSLISNNIELLKGRIDSAIIEKFVQYIKKLGPDADFIEFIRSCCSCLGQGITSMQELSMRVIYEVGACASEDLKNKYGNNRRDILLNFGLSDGDPVASFPDSEKIHNFEGWGAEVLRSGIKDILVSWNHSDTKPWDLGQPYLYHSPQALDFSAQGVDQYCRTAVSLSELMWVFSPVECYHLVYRKGEEAWLVKEMGLKDDALSQRKFTAQTILAKYALQQILLMKEMCMNRSLNCIRAIEKEWPASPVVCGLFDRRLPQTVRAAFADLALFLHVDRLPHIEMQLPSMVRVPDRMPSWPDEITLPYRSAKDGVSGELCGKHFHQMLTMHGAPGVSEVGKFVILELAIKNTFEKLQGCQTHEAQGQNSLVSSLTALTSSLIRFGFFTSFDNLHAVAGPIAQVVDGRNDRLRDKKNLRDSRALSILSKRGAKWNSAKENGNGAVAMAASTRQECSQVTVSEEMAMSTSIPGEVKRPGEFNEKRIQKFLKQQKAKNASRVPNAVLPVENGASTDPENAEAKAVLDEIVVHDEDCDFKRPEDRHMVDDNSRVVMGCKQNMAQALLRMLQIGTDVFLSRIVQRMTKAVKEGDAAVGTSPPQELIDDILEVFTADKKFNMHKISGIQFNAALVDLMMYEKDDLLETALTLMYESNNQLAVALTKLPKLQILTSQDAIELHDQVKQKLFRLELLLSSYEVWSSENDFSGIEREKVKESNELFVELRQLLSTSHDSNHSGSGVGSGAGTDTAIPDPTVQNICRSLGLLRVVFVAFNISCRDNLYESDLESDKTLHDILTLACQLLIQYVRDHTLNQLELFNQIKVLLPYMQQHVDADILMTEMCRNNIQICEEMPQEVFDVVVDQIKMGSLLPRFLSLIDAWIWVNQVVCPHAKYQFISFLSDPDTKECVLGPLLSFISVKKSEEGAMDLTIEDKIKVFSSDDQLSEPLECFRKWKTQGDAEVVYLIKLLDLFSHLAHGRDASAEGFLQNILSAKSIALCFVRLQQIMADSKDTLGSRLVFWELKRSLLTLLETAFFDSSVKDEEYAFSSLHTMLCRQVMTDIRYCCERLSREASVGQERPDCEGSAIVRYISDGGLRMLCSFFEHMFRADLVESHLQAALQPMITVLKDAAAQVAPWTKLRDKLEQCSKVVRKAASALKQRNPLPASAQPTQLSRTLTQLTKATEFESEHEGHLRNEVDQPQPVWQLEQMLSSLNDETALCILEAAGDKTNELLHHLAKSLQKDPSVRQQIKRDHLHMVTEFSSGDSNKHKNQTRSHAAHKRVQISRQRVFRRLIDWCQRHPTKYVMIRMVLQILITDLHHKAPLTVETMAEGPSAVNAVLDTICDLDGPWDVDTRKMFEKAQTEIARWGVVKLIVCILPSHSTPPNLLAVIFEMAKLILVGGNVEVQQIFEETFKAYDESIFFDNMYQLQIQVVDSFKPLQKLKDSVLRNGHADSAQLLQIVKMQSSITSLCRVNNMLQLLCENQNTFMQNYLRHQSDDTKSENMLEHTYTLFSKLCTNVMELDQMGVAEAAVISSRLEFLNEMLHGPCEANQEYVAGTGIIDIFMKICKARFQKLCELEDNAAKERPGSLDALTQFQTQTDSNIIGQSSTIINRIREEEKKPPPKLVAKLKGLIFVCLNALLEGRTDLTVHKRVAVWLDTRVLKDCIVEYHTLFLIKCNQGQKDPSAKELSEAEMQTLLTALSEEEVEDIFHVPLELMTLVRAISDTDRIFKSNMEPARPSRPVENSFVDPVDYDKAYKNYVDACKYLQAFTFFRMQVRGIEIVLPSQKLSMLYFRKPAVAWYLLQSTKTSILNQIDLSTEDGKISGFVEVIADVFVQVRHTQKLEEWQLPCGVGPFRRPFRFWLSRDSKNLVRLNRLTLLLSCAICLVLIVTLGDVANQFADQERLLRGGGGGGGGSDESASDGDGDDIVVPDDSLDFVSELAKYTVTCLGICYVGSAGLMVVLSFFLFAPVLLTRETALAEEESNGGVMSLVVGSIGCLAVIFAFAASMYVSMGGDNSYNPWPLLLIFPPSVILTHSAFQKFRDSRPSFFLARIVGTIAELFKAESVAPRLIFTYFAMVSVLTGDPFYYSLLLFDVIFISPDLRSVIAAVIRPAKTLVLMLLLMLIVLFVFAFRIMLTYRDSFDPRECSGLASCFVYTVYRGTTFGDGLGDHMGREEYLTLSRAGFDYIFFWVFTILIFSMVSGVIIDTFGSLRDERNERNDKLANFCFMSGLPWEQIDKAARKLGIADGFHEHVEYRQNKWDYASFIFYIQMKKAEEFTGLESYAWGLMEVKDNQWIPSSRSMFVENAEEMSGQIEQEGEKTDNGNDLNVSNAIAQLEQGQEKITASMREMGAQLQQLLSCHGIESSRAHRLPSLNTVNTLMHSRSVPLTGGPPGKNSDLKSDSSQEAKPKPLSGGSPGKNSDLKSDSSQEAKPKLTRPPPGGPPAKAVGVKSGGYARAGHDPVAAKAHSKASDINTSARDSNEIEPLELN